MNITTDSIIDGLVQELRWARVHEHPMWPAIQEKIQLIRADVALLEQQKAAAEAVHSCATCANRGRVNGLSQETYCESCIWHGRDFMRDHYRAATAGGGK